MHSQYQKTPRLGCRAPLHGTLAVTPNSNSNRTNMRLHAARHRHPGLSVRADAASTVHSIITGDIGGTNARLGLWKCTDFGLDSKPHHKEVYSETYPTSQFATFEECLQAFLDESAVRGTHVEAAALAVAGAVENNRCPMTNTNWVIDGRQIRKQFGFKTAVLNDFEAVGYGIPALQPTDLVPLNDVPMVPEAPKVVMGESAAGNSSS